MKPDEAKSCLKLLAGLFSGQITQEQAKYVTSELATFDAALATRAINEHRGLYAFVDFPQLWQACRALTQESAPKQGAASAKNREPETFPEIIRKQVPGLENLSDWEVILRYWRNQAEADRRDRAGRTREMSPDQAAHWQAIESRNLINFKRRCVGSLIDARMESASAGRVAELVECSIADFGAWVAGGLDQCGRVAEEVAA